MPRARSRKPIEGPKEIIDPRPIEEIEREVFERVVGGKNPLGWAPWGRDPEDGAAVLYCVTDGPLSPRGPTKRVSYMKITKAGLVNFEPKLKLINA